MNKSSHILAGLTIAALALGLLTFTKSGRFMGATDKNGAEAGRGGETEGEGGVVGGSEPFFAMVIVMTDRLQLDRQLGDTVEQFLEAHDIALLRCNSSAQLQQALSGPAASRPRAVLRLLHMSKVTKAYEKRPV